PSPEATSSQHTTSSIPLPSIPTAPIPTVTQTDTTLLYNTPEEQGLLSPLLFPLLQRQHLELLAKFQAQDVEINRLKERVKYLEDKEGVIGDKSRDDAPIKRRRSNEGEAAAEKISTNSEEIARVLTSLDAANVIAGESNVPTASGFTPTTGPPATIVSIGSEVGPTASPIVRRRKGKEIMLESDT
nr:hypothetical protein [Tanacetum cinerariifolium]